VESVVEEEVDIIDFVHLCEELEAPERRVIVKNMHIQHDKLEIGGGVYHIGEQLEEFGVEPT
jgi:hypothetical protein